MIGKEILATVAALSRKNELEFDEVFGAVEKSLSIAARKDYDSSGNIELVTKIDRETGSYSMFQKWTVVDDNEKSFDDKKHLYDDQAEEKYGKVAEIGEEFLDFLSTDRPLSRVAAQVFKNTVRENINTVVKLNAQIKYTDKIGCLYKVEISHFLKGSDVIVLIDGTVEGVMKKESLQKGDRFKQGQIVDAVLLEIVDNYKGQQLIFDRNSDAFVSAIIGKEVREISEGEIFIEKISRLKGRKGIFAVNTDIPKLEPVAACIGARGSRVKSIRTLIGGEAIEFIEWSDDIEILIQNALNGKANQILIDQAINEIDIGFPVETLNSFKNKANEQILLAELTGMDIRFYTAEELEKKQNSLVSYYIELYKEKLDIEHDLAELLVIEGFEGLDVIAHTSLREYLEIEEFDKELVEELKSRANDALNKDEAKTLAECKNLYSGLISVLNENDVKSIEDLAYLELEELKSILNLRSEQSMKIIMEAKNIFFK